MSALPTKRVLVYVVVGAVVLLVGVLALVSMRAGGSAAGEGLVITGPGSDTLSAVASPTSSTVTTQAPRTIFVQVAGAVRRPGVYEMGEGARVFQAVEQAGGFAAEADREAVPLAAQVADGSRVYVPEVGEEVPAGEGVAVVSGGVAAPQGDGLVSLNSGTLSELDSLPGIGPATAQKIIDHRDAKGPFTSIDQLTDVPGIGPAKLEQIKPLVGL